MGLFSYLRCLFYIRLLDEVLPGTNPTSDNDNLLSRHPRTVLFPSSPCINKYKIVGYNVSFPF